MSTKICKECGKLFTKKLTDLNISFNQKLFCSKDCRVQYHKNNFAETPFYKKRFIILRRDDFRCIYCGKSSIEDMIELEIDHIVPECKTNNNFIDEDINNLVTSCIYCNQGKKRMELTEEQRQRILNRITHHNTL